MRIKGIHGVSLIDYSGHVASVLFTGGCSFACPFCQNPELVTGLDRLPDVATDDALEFLTRRRNFIDAVVFSGGEPTMHPGLPAFASRVKDLGLRVKVDTNGYHPAALRRLIEIEAVDYVAMDIKTSLPRYPEAAGKLVDLSKIDESISLLLESGRDGEFRTTVVPGLVERDDLRAIAERIRGAKRYALQQFETRTLLDPTLAELSPLAPDVLRQWAEIARPYVGEVLVRGV
jgi:pyruvate formate lyase activating enzyme